jgi:hypothetical protein
VAERDTIVRVVGGYAPVTLDGGSSLGAPERSRLLIVPLAVWTPPLSLLNPVRTYWKFWTAAVGASSVFCPTREAPDSP